MFICAHQIHVYIFIQTNVTRRRASWTHLQHWKWYRRTKPTWRHSRLRFFFSFGPRKKNLNDLYALAYEFMLRQFYSGRNWCAADLALSLFLSHSYNNNQLDLLPVSVCRVFAASACEQHFPSRKLHNTSTRQPESGYSAAGFSFAEFCRCRNYDALALTHFLIKLERHLYLICLSANRCAVNCSFYNIMSFFRVFEACNVWHAHEQLNKR